jgi:glycosyltransferase involved in cell wall biosynthesis
MERIEPDHPPRVTVVIPAYNTAHLVAQCLASVFSQTFRDFEVIVVNDGSPDTNEMEKALHPYMQKIVYIRQENKRAAGARNAAIRAARGEFLAFLDSDDTWLPYHLSRQMELFDQNPTLDMVYSNALLLEASNGRNFMDKCPSIGDANFSAIVYERCQIAISTVVIRKESIVEAGFFDENLARCDDYDLWLRAAFHGSKIGYSRKVQAKLNAGRPGSLGQSRCKMVEAYSIILEKVLRTLPLSEAQRTLVRARSTDVKTRWLIEQAKCELAQGQFDKARELFSGANESVPQPKLTLALIGLDLAPRLAGKLILFWNRMLEGS